MVLLCPVRLYRSCLICLIWHRGTIDELNFSEGIEQIDSRMWRKKILAFRRKSGSCIFYAVWPRSDIGFSRNVAIKICQLFTEHRSQKDHSPRLLYLSVFMDICVANGYRRFMRSYFFSKYTSTKGTYPKKPDFFR